MLQFLVPKARDPALPTIGLSFKNFNSMNSHLFKALLLGLITQAATYFQLQGQFIWKGFRDNPYAVALLGYPVSLLLIFYTKESALAFGGETWPGRIIGISIGVIVFAALSFLCLKENVTPKTLVCIALAITILGIQIFWK